MKVYVWGAVPAVEWCFANGLYSENNNVRLIALKRVSGRISFWFVCLFLCLFCYLSVIILLTNSIPTLIVSFHLLSYAYWYILFLSLFLFSIAIKLESWFGFSFYQYSNSLYELMSGIKTYCSWTDATINKNADIKIHRLAETQTHSPINKHHQAPHSQAQPNSWRPGIRIDPPPQETPRSAT